MPSSPVVLLTSSTTSPLENTASRSIAADGLAAGVEDPEQRGFMNQFLCVVNLRRVEHELRIYVGGGAGQLLVPEGSGIFLSLFATPRDPVEGQW